MSTKHSLTINFTNQTICGHIISNVTYGYVRTKLPLVERELILPGLNHVEPVETYPDEKWDEMIAVLLSAPFHLIKRFLPLMKQKGILGYPVRNASMFILHHRGIHFHMQILAPTLYHTLRQIIKNRTHRF